MTLSGLCAERTRKNGEVREWLKRAASKAAIPERVSGVRIPPSPPDSLLSHTSAPVIPHLIPETAKGGGITGKGKSSSQSHEKRNDAQWVKRRNSCASFARSLGPGANDSSGRTARPQHLRVRLDRLQWCRIQSTRWWNGELLLPVSERHQQGACFRFPAFAGEVL